MREIIIVHTTKMVTIHAIQATLQKVPNYLEYSN